MTKSKRVEILLAQLKSYEEKENSSLYDKYFPNNTNPRNVQCSVSASCSSQPHNQCCHTLAHRCPDLKQCTCPCECSSASHRVPPPNSFDKEVVTQLIHSLKADHEKIMSALTSSTISHAHSSSSTRDHHVVQTGREDEVMQSSYQENNEVSDEILNEDLSINSIEYLIPDNPSEENDLNL